MPLYAPIRPYMPQRLLIGVTLVDLTVAFQASDEKHVVTRQLIVRVLDSNDNAPEFSQQAYEVRSVGEREGRGEGGERGREQGDCALLAHSHADACQYYPYF